MAVPILTCERLRALLHYDPETGVFTWRAKKARANAGDIAGCVASTRYLVIRVDGVLYLAHRLAWFYMTGEWPAHQVDHRDLDRANNRWANLRPAENAENMRNTRAHADSFHGIKGVYLDTRVGKWVARIMVGGVVHWLGQRETAEDARALYAEAATRLHGDFARHA